MFQLSDGKCKIRFKTVQDICNKTQIFFQKKRGSYLPLLITRNFLIKEKFIHLTKNIQKTTIYIIDV